jgi:predicted molibdopterin-dependent oxidoreductase YjgC
MLGGVSYDDIGGSGYRWPDDEAVLYRDAFEAGVAAFVDVQPLLDPSADEALELVTGGRASGADHPDEPPLRVHPDDAARRDVRAGDTVVVSGDGAAVEATADTDDAVRQGTVYLHATVADPLVRAGVRTVTVTSVERPRPE